MGDVMCPKCGAKMTLHAEKVNREATRDTGVETIDVEYCCPSCGTTTEQRKPG